ncbi:MAG: PHB depolymerase family esterase [Hyphomicrobiaceae bacterium]
MKRLVAGITGLGMLAAFAASCCAQDRVPGDVIRDRIRDRMEQRRLERVPILGGAAKVPGAAPGYESIVIAGKTRTFMRYTPNRVLGKKAPVVFALHGAKGTADRLAGYLGLNDVADREGFVVVYPQGEKNRWNDGRAADKTGGGEASDANDFEFLNRLADALVVQGVADRNRIYMLGVSNGGFMAFNAACNVASRFAAYASVIASMPVEAIAKCKPGRAVPVMMINATADELIKIDGGPGKFGISGNAPPMDVAKHFAELAGCKSVSAMALPDADPKDGTRVSLSSWGGCVPGSGIEFYAVDGGGHQAPARGKVTGGFVLDMFLGTRSHDIDTAEAAWAFFRGLGK